MNESYAHELIVTYLVFSSVNYGESDSPAAEARESTGSRVSKDLSSLCDLPYISYRGVVRRSLGTQREVHEGLHEVIHLGVLYRTSSGFVCTKFPDNQLEATSPSTPYSETGLRHA